MKHLSLILSFVLCITLSAQSITPILDRKVSLKINNQKLSYVLEVISETAGFSFSYSNHILNPNQTVTLFAENRTVKVILDQLFKDQVTYQQIGNHLVLQKKVVPKIVKQSTSSTPSKYPFIVTGYVRDSQTGSPISHVSIYEKQTLTSAFSGDFGYYKINVTSKSPVLKLNFSNSEYQDTVVTFDFENNGVINCNINLLSTKTSIEEDFQVVDSSVLITFTDSQSNRNQIIEKSEFQSPIKAFLKIEDINIGKWVMSKYQSLNEKNILDSFERNWQVTFIPPIGSNGKLSSLTSNRLSLNLLAGYNGGLNGVEFGGLVNIIRKEVHGVQFAGLSNLVGGNYNGVQFAGISNQNLSETKGVQFAGISNYNNLASKVTQFAGICNINRGDLEGFQAAGVLNLAAYKTNAVQIGGVINVANEINGGQIAGVINIARKVKGFQIGLINIADSAEGMTLGLINIIKNGIHQLEINQNENNMVGLAFRSGTKKLHSIIALNSEWPIGSRNSILAYGFGLGSNFKITKPLNLNIGLISQQLSKNFDSENLKLYSRLFINTELTLFKGFSVFAGATVNHLIADINDVDYQSKLKDFGNTPFLRIDGSYPQHAWLGYQFGIRLF